jgi:hypothetical protein
VGFDANQITMEANQITMVDNGRTLAAPSDLSPAGTSFSVPCRTRRRPAQISSGPAWANPWRTPWPARAVSCSGS